LAAAHQLESAASELESVRASVGDVALRNITSIMLMGIYLEEASYPRAQAILEETFQARSVQKDDSIRTYFALAGQAINGVRSHLARYRSSGINTSDADLPDEALNDIERLRALLERMVAQASEITKDSPMAYDALALQEDVLGIRLSLARDSDDRDKWESQYAAAREQLASAQIKVATIGRLPAFASASPKVANPVPFKKPSEESAGGVPSVPSATGSSKAPQPAPGQAGTTGTPENKSDEVKTLYTGSLGGRESKRLTPSYPAQARMAGVSGVVRVNVTVDEKGKVSVNSSEGPTLLRQAAEDAARGWGFPPTIIAGRAVRVSGFIDFEFKL
jgi:TonB family protein